MLDWASYFEHLQFILQEFDKKEALEESNLIQFFRKGLRSSIKIQIEQRGREHNT